MRNKKKYRRVKEFRPPDTRNVSNGDVTGDKFMEDTNKEKTERLVKLFWDRLEDIEKKKKAIMEQLEGSWSNNSMGTSDSLLRKLELLVKEQDKLEETLNKLDTFKEWEMKQRVEERRKIGKMELELYSKITKKSL